MPIREEENFYCKFRWWHLHDCATFGRTEADLMGIGIWINNTAGFLLLVPRLKVA
jgi:hypothetical protein